MLSHLKELVASVRVRRFPFVSIDPTAKICYRKLRVSQGDTLSVGAGSIVEASVVSDKNGAVIKIGSGCFIGSSHIISAQSIVIGDNVLISWGCHIVDHDSHALDPNLRRDDVRNWGLGIKKWNNVAISGVTIEDNAWIGFNVIILKGVTVGRGSVIGAGSVVTKSVSPMTVVAGNPARVIRDLSNGK